MVSAPATNASGASVSTIPNVSLTPVMAAKAPVPPPPPWHPTKPLGSLKKSAPKIVYHFETSVFYLSQFPGHPSFQQDSLTRDTLGPWKVETTFYNANFQEVKQADTPGRYGAVVRLFLGDGTETDRFITLYRSPKMLPWLNSDWHFAPQIPPELGIDPSVATEQQPEINESLRTLLADSTKENSYLAILLAGLAETPPGSGPQPKRLNPVARDQAWWFKLRKQIKMPEPTYPYEVYLPDGYDAQPDKKWPLILFLHGSGQRGDNLKDLNVTGLPQLIAKGQKFPAIIISPQCPADEWWQDLILDQLLNEVTAKYRVDPDRVSVTGLSMGGFGTWAMALDYPDRFSAIAPICGASDPSDAARIAKLPVWAFHGQRDPIVPFEQTVQMVDALKQAGGHPHVTLFPNADHNSWTPAYNMPALYDWLVAQKRGETEVVVPGVPTN